MLENLIRVLVLNFSNKVYQLKLLAHVLRIEKKFLNGFSKMMMKWRLFVMLLV